MTCMIDKWHDRYHTTDGQRDYLNCPYCQDELAEEMHNRPSTGPTATAFGATVDIGPYLEDTYDPDGGLIDRLEDLED